MHVVKIDRKKYPVPSTWDEVAQMGRFVKVMRVLATGHADTRLARLAKIFVPVKPKVWRAIGEGAADLLQLVRWITVTPFVKPYVARLRVGLRWLRLPEAELLDAVGIEYADAEHHARQMAEGNPEALHDLLAVLCRPARRERGVWRRVPYNADECRARLPIMRRLPPWAKLYVGLYFTGCVSQLRATYAPIFKDGPKVEETKRDPLRPQFQEFGWVGTFFQVAEGGAFGTFDRVANSSIHELCYYLAYKGDQAERQRWQSNSSKKFQP